MAVKIPQNGVSGFLDKKVTFYIHKQYVYIPQQIHVDKYIFCANRGKHRLCHLKSYARFLLCNARNLPDKNKCSKYYVYKLFICITKESIREAHCFAYKNNTSEAHDGDLLVQPKKQTDSRAVMGR
jgi:hypothetical protein